MPESYKEIVEDIESFDTDEYPDYSIIHKYFDKYVKKENDDYYSWFVPVALDISRRVRDAVAGDPSEWWVEDADGNRVHIGDDVKSDYSGDLKVVDFGYRDGRRTVEYGDGFDYADTVRKVVPDTREKIIADTIEKLAGFEPAKSIIEQAVDRAMKLGAGQ